jgi:predicted RNA-binding Zn-ribbon protein involved in translation (DUF1610 family)
MDEHTERKKSAPIATTTRVPPQDSESEENSDERSRSILTATRVPQVDAATSHDVPAKATLFCLNCDHQSRVDGDWQVLRENRTVHYICPDCGTEIAVRPTPSQAQ